jgi:hypothetical protein
LFNRTLNGDRSTIERAFAHLKMKFRRLKFLNMLRLDLIPSVIIACCCLQNFIIEVDGLDEDDNDYADGSDEDENEDDNFPMDREAHIGHIKRNRIASML